MAVSEIDVEKGALLHDIGKVFQRAEGRRKKHSEIGVQVLKPYFSDNTAVLKAVAYHHQQELAKAGLKADDISYIVYEADNIAAAADRRDLPEEGDEAAGKKFNSTMPLHNVFNVFSRNNNQQNSAYPLRGFGEAETLPYPEPVERIQAPPAKYKKMAQYIRDCFSKRSPQDMTVSELLQVLAATMTYVPSSTNTAEVPDISLFDHSKLTAAYAVCMWHYFQEQKIKDYKKYCFGSSKNAELRNKPVYLVVSGDMSGIQKFIYTIPSKGALKSLRGRSLYLDVLLEHIADEILSACHVSRSCLLYTGGGHFYMLLPNTHEVQILLEQIQIRLNDWFLRYYGSHLYLALAYTPCTAQEFMKDGSGAGRVFQRVSRKLARAKLCRYSERQLQDMFDPHSQCNELADAGRECAICHRSAIHLHPYGDADTGDEACETCNSLFVLGKKSLDNNVFYISSEKQDDSVPLPGLAGDLYLTVVSEDDLPQLPAPKRLYIKNELTLGRDVKTALWMGDYTYRNQAGHPMEFAELVQQSGGSESETSIERLGVLRADVDNLGAAFIAGFSGQYDTLSRKAALSRSLSLFFKCYIKWICEGHRADHSAGFTLFAEEQKISRKLHVIYSGGDDLFLVGTWDDIIEAAIDLRHSFQKFTNGKLTFSAGIGFFTPSFPIAQMARKTGDLEDYAKDNPGKNSVALFGEVTEVGSHSEKQLTARYTWDEFEKGVCQEKLHFLEETMALSEDECTYKLSVGKGLLYRLLSLLRDAERESVNIARFAYVLARMEPKQEEKQKMQCYQKVRTTFYSWYQSAKDRQQLITAIELLIYHKRDKEGKDEA